MNKDKNKKTNQGNLDKKTKTASNKMGVMNVRKLIWTMSLPAMVSMLIQAMYNIVDSMFVAMVSEKALASVSLIFPIHMLIISFGVGTGVGLSSLIARQLGAKRYEEANSAASHGFFLAFCTWIVFALAGFFFSESFVRLFTDDPYILKNATLFCQILTMVSIFPFIIINVEKMLQATGNMIAPMIFNIVGAVLNIVLNPIFVFGLLGAPRLEVIGSIVATSISQFIAMLISLFMIFALKHDIKIKIKGFKVSWATIKDIYAVGAPTIVMQAIGSFMITGLNAILIMFSETAVAVLGIYFRVQSFIFMPIFGLNQGTMPVLAYNYGAENKERLLKAYKVSLMIALSIMAIGTLFFQIYPEKILHIFSASEQMLEIGVVALRIISISFIPAAYSIITTTMFGALNHGIFSMTISIIRQLVVILPLSWVLAHFMGLDYVWASFPIAEISALLLTSLFYRYTYRKEIKNLGEKPEGGCR